MTFRFCPYEQQVTETLQAGGWPEACEPTLRAHVETCRGCAELVLVAQALRQSGAQTVQAARVPSPGVIWWRTQLQRRQQDVARATRPIALAEQAGAVAVLLCVLGVAVWQRASLFAWWHRLAGVPSLDSLRGQAVAALTGLTANWTLPLLIAALSTMAGLAGFAVYLLAGRD